METMQKILSGMDARSVEDLTSRQAERQRRMASEIAKFVEVQKQELSAEKFALFISELLQGIFSLINSSDATEKLGGILLIDNLITVCQSDNLMHEEMIRFMHYLRRAFEQPSKPEVLQAAAKAMAHLAMLGGPLSADIVSFEVKQGTEWLQHDHPEHNQLAAVFVIGELALKSPTLFNVHVEECLKVLPEALKSIKPNIRNGAKGALRGCLVLLSHRDMALKRKLWMQLHQKALHILDGPQQSSDAYHGGLLILGELLRNADYFKDEKMYREVGHKILSYMMERNPFVKRTVIELQPELAKSPFYGKNFLKPSLSFILDTLQKGKTEIKETCFEAIGDIYEAIGDTSKEVSSKLENYLPQIVKHIRMGLIGKGRNSSITKACQKCVSKLACSVGSLFEPLMKSELIEPLFDEGAEGLSETLVSTLTTVSCHIPSLEQTIQMELESLIFMILDSTVKAQVKEPISKKPTTPSISSVRIIRHSITAYNRRQSDQQPTAASPELLKLALECLAKFNLHEFGLLPFVRETVAVYLDDDDVDVRKQAVITTCKLLQRVVQYMQQIRWKLVVEYRHRGIIVAEVLERLLIVGIVDIEPNIRRTVLENLYPDFDHFLSQSESLQSLFIALNDEDFPIRKVAMTLIGRLARRNPALVIPSLRKTLIQLLTDLEFSKNPVTRQQSSEILGFLIEACEDLIKPYVYAIFKVLHPKFADPNREMCTSILKTMGKLTVVAGADMRPFTHDLLPVIVRALKDKGSEKRLVALRTLGALVESTGAVVEPYKRHRHLLQTILETLHAENREGQQWEVRREVIRVIGIIGAFDPYLHRQNLEDLQAEEKRLKKARKQQKDTDEVTLPKLVVPTDPEIDDHSKAAVISLLRILRDKGQSSLRKDVLHTIMIIYQLIGVKCKSFLRQTIPTFVANMETCDISLRKLIFKHLLKLIIIVGKNIRTYLDGIFRLIHKHWSNQELQPAILDLIKGISEALQDEFKVYLPDLIPLLLNVLQNDKSNGCRTTINVLTALQSFGNNLEDHLFLIIPPLMRLCEHHEAPIEVKRKGIRTVTNLCRTLNFSAYTSRIIHPLVRILRGEKELQQEAVKALGALLTVLNNDYAIFIPMVHKILKESKVHNQTYSKMVEDLVNPMQDYLYDVDEKSLGLGKTNQDKGDVQNNYGQQRNIVLSHDAQKTLQRIWNAETAARPDDWKEWLRAFQVELLKQNPCHALRNCAPIAQKHHPLASELFNNAFLSCWTELFDDKQDDLISALSSAFSRALIDKVNMGSANVPPEVLQTLLNMTEFMEHKSLPLPLDTKLLGQVAELCHSYAKALRYKEQEFLINPSQTVEALMSINNRLQQAEAADGILDFTTQRNFHGVEVKPSWYEKLNRWEDALHAYEKCQLETPSNLSLTLGRLRSLESLGDHVRVGNLVKKTWSQVVRRLQVETCAEVKVQLEEIKKPLAMLGASAGWNLKEWDVMEKYVESMDPHTTQGAFYRAILAVQQNCHDHALKFIDQTRKFLDPELTALVGESYTRAYKHCVLVQQLVELEEIIQYKSADETRKQQYREMWSERLKGCMENVDIWQQILSVRSLVMKPKEDIQTWLKFASLCRQSERLSLSERVLTNLLGADSFAEVSDSRESSEEPTVTYAYTKHLWAIGELHPAKERLAILVARIESMKNSDPVLLANCYLQLGQWERSSVDKLSDQSIKKVLSCFEKATSTNKESYQAWHAWALMHYEVISHFEISNQRIRAKKYIVPGVKAFFRSIELDEPDQKSSGRKLQDILRLLYLWFKYGHEQNMPAALENGFNTIPVKTWLQVIPQIIARIHINESVIRRQIERLLNKIGVHHPQSLVYSLTVASKSPSPFRRAAANSILDEMRKHQSLLVEQAELVSNELIRVAILWFERWSEAIEEASRLYFGQEDIEGMFAQLEPLHEVMDKGPTTLREVGFQQAYGRDLAEARDWCRKYRVSRNESDLSQAWEFYCRVFRKISKQLPQLTELELQYVSPQLRNAKDLELAIPGTYEADKELIKIKGFSPSLKVIESKQRPRRLTIYGSDGEAHEFLLKGHEDLRQDERVMQLFGLVNTLLADDIRTSHRRLNIKCIAIIPLATNSGLIEWMPNTDTLHALIKEYRECRKILLNIEHRLIQQMTTDYANLTLMQKVEAFEYALGSTTGRDLANVFWLKSLNSEVWLDRRTTYTRSLAVMSMVGYILGLGDRHPSNLMVDRNSGKLIHIDFGDCFEVAMQRDKFPERFPFRLTRMLINAMEVSGIEGNFRSTCENVMRVLRQNKESVMAVLEAFVHDPLINWRLLKPTKNEDTAEAKPKKEVLSQRQTEQKISVSQEARSIIAQISQTLNDHSVPHHPSLLASRTMMSKDSQRPVEIRNEKALVVIKRVSDKLGGNDFEGCEKLPVKEQVKRLILEATSHINLSQAYIGWCPLW